MGSQYNQSEGRVGGVGRLAQIVPRSPPREQRDHALFRNPQTARRFPELAAIPPEDFSVYFPGVQQPPPRSEQPCQPPVDTGPTTAGHTLRRPVSPRDTGRPPFCPCNPSQARKEVGGSMRSIFDGADYDSVKAASTQARRRHRELVEAVALDKSSHRTRDFSPSCASKARDAIRSNVFQGSVDEDTRFMQREATRMRAIEGITRYHTEGWGRAKSPPRRGGSPGRY
eukprot:TRINITY_DN60118_c0_g1_i1.p1 TRINITY_DN60118_c0_g1~~TRINITY_DN60118_c0_g1_i1.p1  ORF type:complete len:249 (+),score=68.61 TRINITY_DN60118_c0_g1_i1:69-749(+)